MCTVITDSPCFQKDRSWLYWCPIWEGHIPDESGHGFGEDRGRGGGWGMGWGYGLRGGGWDMVGGGSRGWGARGRSGDGGSKNTVKIEIVLISTYVSVY